MLADILLDETCHGILLDIGMPVLHRGTRYNARIISYNGKILLIRPKLYLAQEGNYREMRYFTPWNRPAHTETYELRELPDACLKLQGSTTCLIGDGIVEANDCTIGAETCEELFTPYSPHNSLSLAGCEIITNSSGSHHELRKLDTRIALIQEATRKCGGIYLYANQQGCDGDRLYYDGCAMIIVNGSIRAQGSQFSLKQVEVVTATVSLEEVWAFRTSPSRGLQAITAPQYERVKLDYKLSPPENEYDSNMVPTPERPLRTHTPEEEIALGPACWLADYLFRSKAAGFFIPLSGGLDSASTATIVYSMCTIIMKELKEGNEEVKKNVLRLWGAYHPDGSLPETPQQFCNVVLSTAYLGMREQSSPETRNRAQRLAEAIGCHHSDLDIDDVFHAQKGLLTTATGYEPKFKVHGGDNTTNLVLQNIQARSRMVTSYSLAQLIPTARGRANGGSLLVLGSGNVDECLRGYLTKYDCSSADLNPIGSISKVDLKRFLHYATTALSLPILTEFLDATPTAELEPITADYVQSDEADMGMTYVELSEFGKLRKEAKLGPYGMFMRLSHLWKHKTHPDGREYSIRDIADKVKRFHHFYAINRHKMTTMTPAYHAEAYSPDDNRFDLRPFLYPAFFGSWSFKKIDEAVERIEGAQRIGEGDGKKV
jgi:NAD+ synthase (glutamine-hydrolysing)